MLALCVNVFKISQSNPYQFLWKSQIVCSYVNEDEAKQRPVGFCDRLEVGKNTFPVYSLWLQTSVTFLYSIYIYIYISWKNVSNEMCIFVLRNNEKCFVLKEGNEETMYNMYSNIYHKAERLL